ncbi:hypothetical protein HYS91_04535 [Candidatus Daviesbacteria bacterium]|nr:hypothetical protein [Candidatus Daviesbacteria bacterium]
MEGRNKETVKVQVGEGISPIRVSKDTAVFGTRDVLYQPEGSRVKSTIPMNPTGSISFNGLRPVPEIAEGRHPFYAEYVDTKFGTFRDRQRISGNR